MSELKESSLKSTDKKPMGDSQQPRWKQPKSNSGAKTASVPAFDDKNPFANVESTRVKQNGKPNFWVEDLSTELEEKEATIEKRDFTIEKLREQIHGLEAILRKAQLEKIRENSCKER